MTYPNKFALALAAGMAVTDMSGAAMADNAPREVGEVDTAVKLFGPNHQIRIVAFEDPEIEGVTCWISRPVAGGISGALGFAEEVSDVAIACRQTGAIVTTGDIERGIDGEEVFNENRSVWFKELRVTRFFDEAANTLVYLTSSTKLIDGSPKNSVSSVVMMPWQTEGIQPVIR
jgi:CreA protein